VGPLLEDAAPICREVKRRNECYLWRKKKKGRRLCVILGTPHSFLLYLKLERGKKRGLGQPKTFSKRWNMLCDRKERRGLSG